jgi:plasmid stability protein
MIQIRNVPAKVHRMLKARAALSGMSAESLEAPLVTLDTRAVHASGQRAVVEVIRV